MAARTTTTVQDAPHKDGVPITVVDDLPSFAREAAKIFSASELDALIDHVARFRELGDLMPGTGGLRKLRWHTDNNKGKSHGARVIYYYGDDQAPLYLIAVYPKSKKVNLSAAEKKAAKKFVETLKRVIAEDRRRRLKIIK